MNFAKVKIITYQIEKSAND